MVKKNPKGECCKAKSHKVRVCGSRHPQEGTYCLRVCVTNCWHEILRTYRVENDAISFSKFLDEVTSNIPKRVTPVFGLEDTEWFRKTLFQFLLKFKRTVKGTSPVQLKLIVKEKELSIWINLTSRYFLHLQDSGG